MNRRTYLATVAALATGSGCVDSVLHQNPSNQMRKAVSVSNVAKRSPNNPEQSDEGAKRHGLTFAVTVIDAEITPRSTAKVRLTYTNAGADTLSLNINPAGPDPLYSETEDPGLVLLSDAQDAARASTPCWKPRQEGFPVPAVVYQHALEPGESERLDYEVWAGPQQEADCIEPGDFEFNPLFGTFTLSVSSH